MKVDLSGMINSIKNEVDERESNQSSNSTNGYPLVYPIHKGKLTFRLLYNVKGNMVMRKVCRHQGEKFKIPCLTMFEGYSGSCPICDSINEVEAMYGKESGVAKKHGLNEKYIAYAKLIDGEAAYFDDEKGPRKGDIVILMFPWSIYTAIQNIILESEQQGQASKIVSENEGLPLVIENTGGRPLYNTYVFPYGVQKAYNTDEEFDNMLMELPDLRETIVARMLTEKDQTDARALSDTIKTQYMSGMYVNPQAQVAQQPVQQNQVPVQNTVPNNPVQQPVTTGTPIPQPTTTVTVEQQVPAQTVQQPANPTARPECFGKHENNGTKCILCPMEPECMSASQGA